MTGIDTNVVVRHFIDDDPAQAAAVRRLREKAEADGDTLYISHVVLSELCWVTKSLYAFSREEIATMVRSLIDDPLFSLEDALHVEEALKQFTGYGGDFPDNLIGIKAKVALAVPTRTFDKRAAKLPDFALLK